MTTSTIQLPTCADLRTEADATKALDTLKQYRAWLKMCGKLTEEKKTLIKNEFIVFDAIRESGTFSSHKPKSTYERAACWYAQLDDVTATRYKTECIQSLASILEIFRREDKAEQEARVCQKYEKRKQDALSALEEFGEVDLKHIFPEVRYDRLTDDEYMPDYHKRNTLIDSVKNRTKDALLKRGAVCVGESQYVKVENCSYEQFSYAIVNRLMSISDDIKRASRISKEWMHREQVADLPEVYIKMNTNGKFTIESLNDIGIPVDRNIDECTAMLLVACSIAGMVSIRFSSEKAENSLLFDAFQAVTGTPAFYSDFEKLLSSYRQL